VILLTDHTKFGHVSYSIVAPVDVLDKVITDSGIRSEDKAALEERGIEVVVVERSVLVQNLLITFISME